MSFDDIVSDLEIASSVIYGISGDDSGMEDDERLPLGSSDSEDQGQSEIVEYRPQRSPYASDVVALRFSPSQTLRIPRQFLEKTPLAARLQRCKPPNEMDLGPIRFDAGHVIVNFLVTGKYQCLEPWGTTAAGKYSSEFRTALRVYMAAESLGLIELFNLAQEEVKKAGDKLNFPQVVDNVHFLDPFHAHFPWIGEYIQSRMISFWESVTVEQATKMTSDILGPSNLHKILIGGLLKMKASGVERESEFSISMDLVIDLIRNVKDTTKRLNEVVEKLPSPKSTKELIDSTDTMTLQPMKPGTQATFPQQDQPHLYKSEVNPVPNLPPKRNLKDVEDEAVLEQAELTTLLSKSLDKEETPLGISWADEERLILLERKSDRRAEVLNAKRDWERLDLKEGKANATFKEAMSKEEIFHQTYLGDSSNLTKVVLFRALRKKYHSEKLEKLARRKAAVELYESPTSGPEDALRLFPETASIGGSFCSSLSTGQKTPDSGSGFGIVGTCLDLESHLKVGGGWEICAPCRILVVETIRDMVNLPELKVSED